MIVLVKLDAHLAERKYLPYGLLYVGNALEKAGYEVQVLHNTDAQRLNSDLLTFKRTIERNHPLFVGVSVSTGHSTTLSADFSETIKREVGDIPVVWGGVHPTIMAEQVLSESYVDYVVMGEGEETIVELAEAIEGKRSLQDIKGIGYKKNGHPIINPSRPKIRNLDTQEPAWHLINVKTYLNKYRAFRSNYNQLLSYITSRGCPHRCAFCYNQSWHNQQMRYHSVERVNSDIKCLKQEFDIDAVWFNDDNLFVNQKRAFQIIEEADLPWFGEARVNYMIKAKFAEKLKQTNCMCIMSGPESGTDRILKYIKKDITKAQVEKAVKVFGEYCIGLSYSFIIGFPTETWQEIIETVQFISTLDKHYDDNLDLFRPKLGVFLPYPGTPLYKIAVESGFQPPTTTKDWGKIERYGVNFEVPWIDQQKLGNLLAYYLCAVRTRFNRRPDLKLIEKIYKHRLKKDSFGFSFDIKLYSHFVKNLSGFIHRCD